MVMILRPEVNEDEVTTIVERVKSFITDRGGDINTEELWGLRRLAYPIEKFTEAFYVNSSAFNEELVNLFRELVPGHYCEPLSLLNALAVRGI